MVDFGTLQDSKRRKYCSKYNNMSQRRLSTASYLCPKIAEEMFEPHLANLQERTSKQRGKGLLMILLNTHTHTHTHKHKHIL